MLRWWIFHNHADGQYENSIYFSSVPVGQSVAGTPYPYEWWCPYSGGSHTLKVVADGSNYIDESNETNNNSATITINCGSISFNFHSLSNLLENLSASLNNLINLLRK